MNTTITYLFTPILLSSVLAGCGSTLATATTPLAPRAASANVANPFDVDSKTSHAARSVPTSTQIVAQRTSGPRDLGPIQFPYGATTTSVNNFVEGDGIDRYTFDASAGQPARINILSATGQVLLTLIAPDGTPLMRSQSGSASWSGTLPMSGTYRLDAVNQYVGSRYTVNLNIQPAGGNSTQIHNRGSIQFPAGSTNTGINGYLAPQNIDRYSFTASAGQPANITVNSPNGQVLLTLIDPNGNPIIRAQSDATSWSGTLPADGTYRVDVVNQSSPSFYRLGVSITP